MVGEETTAGGGGWGAGGAAGCGGVGVCGCCGGTGGRRGPVWGGRGYFGVEDRVEERVGLFCGRREVSKVLKEEI